MRALPLPLLLWALSACAGTELEAFHDAEGAPGLEVPVSEAHVRRIAGDYTSWGALDQPLRVAPTLCRAPSTAAGPTARLSEAPGGPHGKKLYRLYARDPAAYRGVESGAPQAHQVLVKEAFDAVPFVMPGPGTVPPGVVQTDDGLVRPGPAAGLFVMFRGAGEDEGEHLWSYASVDPLGEVTAIGRIEACIDCHRDAPHGGLFGLDR